MDATVSLLEKNERDLFLAVIRFNTQIAQEIHYDHVSDVITKKLYESLRSSSRGRKHFSEWIHEHLSLSEETFWDFREFHRRLVLLSSADLKRLSTYIGAIIYHRHIAQVIDRRTQRLLRVELGEEVYLYALKRAPFLGFTRVPTRPFDEKPTMQIRNAGKLAMLRIIGDQPTELWKRFFVKVSHDWRELYDETKCEEDVDKGQTPGWPLLLRLIRSDQLRLEGAACFK